MHKQNVNGSLTRPTQNEGERNKSSAPLTSDDQGVDGQGDGRALLELLELGDRCCLMTAGKLDVRIRYEKAEGANWLLLINRTGNKDFNWQQFIASHALFSELNEFFPFTIGFWLRSSELPRSTLSLHGGGFNLFRASFFRTGIVVPIYPFVRSK